MVLIRRIVIFVLLMVSLSWFGYEQKGMKERKTTRILMDYYHGPTVTISGKVIFPEYESGIISVFASRKYYGPPDIALTVISMPGEYSLKVPHHLGDIYLRATHSLIGKKDGNSRIKKAKVYSLFPIRIGSSDIKGVDLTLGKSVILFSGPSVTISGKVIYPEYKEGQQIRISASSSAKRGPADIAFAELSFPGEYSLEVPKDYGDLYIWVTTLQPGEKMPRKDTLQPSGSYRNNPLKIGSVDIKGVDLVFKTRSFLLMDFYPGPTVTISGKVIFADYKSGMIAISVSSQSQVSTDIDLMVIPGPGEYALKVPKNFGDIYLWATNLKLGEKTPLNRPMGKYRQNPLRVGRYDIQGIDIVF